MKGEPHWDTELWATMGHLYAGGMWFLKKDKISGFNANNYQGTDYRTTFNSFNNHSITPGKPSNLNDYFYLPARGEYASGHLHRVGEYGYYWSSTYYQWDIIDVHYLSLSSSCVTVNDALRSGSMQLWTAQ